MRRRQKRRVDDGGPAFPHVEASSYPLGMSLRDYFAAQAMLGLIIRGREYPAKITSDSYAQADAMIRARRKAGVADTWEWEP